MTNIPSFKQYLVEETREVFFTFGRMNPPTIGHGKLMNVMSTKSGKNPYKVFLSQSQDPKKNPLTYEQKVKHVRKMYSKHARSVIKNKQLRNVFEVATSLYDEGFNRITMVVGADRITEFKTLLDKYNGVKGRHGFYNFEKINVVSAGDRDPDSEGVEGMSASKQRENAKNNDFVTFSQGVPSNMSNKEAKRLFNDVRAGMGLKETTSFKNYVDLEPVSEIREKYIEGDLFQENDRVRTESGEIGTIFRLGTNYVILEMDDGNISRQWLDSIQMIEEDIDEGYGTSSVLKDVLPGVYNYFDKLANGKRYKYAVRTFLDLRKKNPNNARRNLVKAAQIADVDIRNLDRVFHDMVKKGVMPKHLLNYWPTYNEETYSPQKHEWGTDASTRYAKKKTPGQSVDEEVSQRQIDDLEKFADRLLAKFNIDIEFTRHFADRMNDKRNNPEISIPELQRLFKKIAREKAKNIKSNVNAEVVLKDIQSDLNLPVVIKYDRKNDEIDVVNKTIMRKKDFKTTSKTVRYEDAVDRARAMIDREIESDKIKHDRILDRARLARTRAKNAKTNPRESKGNPVAKNLNKFNKPATHKDKKKDAKRGYQKHKGQLNGGD